MNNWNQGVLIPWECQHDAEEQYHFCHTLFEIESTFHPLPTI